MRKEITINYEFDKAPINVLLRYDVETDGNLQTITCTVVPVLGSHLEWLHTRKFELRSWLSDGSYMPLYTENEQLYNIEGVLFIEKAYREIMHRENYTVQTA
jgi:hypothetical protein